MCFITDLQATRNHWAPILFITNCDISSIFSFSLESIKTCVLNSLLTANFQKLRIHHIAWYFGLIINQLLCRKGLSLTQNFDVRGCYAIFSNTVLTSKRLILKQVFCQFQNQILGWLFWLLGFGFFWTRALCFLKKKLDSHLTKYLR